MVKRVVYDPPISNHRRLFDAAGTEPTMVERAARAMWEADKLVQSTWDEMIADGENNVVDGYRKLARAAIATMRVPDEAVINAAHAGLCPLEVGKMPCRERIRREWEQGIDAALDPAGTAERGMK